MTKYVCNECGWIGTRKEMYHEMGDVYDQDSCPICHDILFDDMYGYVYCKDLRTNRFQKIKQILKNGQQSSNNRGQFIRDVKNNSW